jgi:tetratricopeptide (TPR) repeat protein
MRPVRHALAIACTLAVLAGAHAARADEATDFEKGRNVYLAREYREAEARFRAMLDPRTGSLHTPSLLDDGHTYLGATLLALGRKDEALEQFKGVLLHNPEYQPDPLTFPTDVLDAFADARKKYRNEILAEKERKAREERERKDREEREKDRQRRYLAAIEAQASQDRVTEHRNRWLAFVPFGVGQFQNNQRALGLGFLGAETALIAGTIVTFAINRFAFVDRERERVALNDYVARQYQDRMNASAWVNYGMWIGLGVVAIVGVIQANVAFVPEVVDTKKRALPQVGWTFGPGGAGVSGSF